MAKPLFVLRGKLFFLIPDHGEHGMSFLLCSVPFPLRISPLPLPLTHRLNGYFFAECGRRFDKPL